MESFWQLTDRPSLKRVSLWRLTIGYAQSSPSLGSSTALSIRRPSSLPPQLLQNAGTWWANYITAHPTNYQVSWVEFRDAFHTHHILAGIMKSKHQELMDLKQGGRSVHGYSKLFNHLTKYAPEQVDTDKRKKYHFMNGLSTKL
jgi:hypothetical protein